MEIEYSEDDKYIDAMLDAIEARSSSVVSFLGIENMPAIKVIIKNNLEEFREDNAKAFGYSVEKLPDWACGFATNNLIEVLTYPLYIQTKGHKDATIDNIINTIIHEFVHSCHDQINENNLTWVAEGFATNLSGQYDNNDSTFMLDASLEDIKNKTVNYSNYYLMFKYLLDNYKKDYILKVLSDCDYQKTITDTVYENTRSIYGVKKH